MAGVDPGYAEPKKVLAEITDKSMEGIEAAIGECLWPGERKDFSMLMHIIPDINSTAVARNAESIDAFTQKLANEIRDSFNTFINICYSAAAENGLISPILARSYGRTGYASPTARINKDIGFSIPVIKGNLRKAMAILEPHFEGISEGTDKLYEHADYAYMPFLVSKVNELKANNSKFSQLLAFTLMNYAKERYPIEHYMTDDCGTTTMTIAREDRPKKPKDFPAEFECPKKIARPHKRGLIGVDVGGYFSEGEIFNALYPLCPEEMWAVVEKSEDMLKWLNYTIGNTEKGREFLYHRSDLKNPGTKEKN